MVLWLVKGLCLHELGKLANLALRCSHIRLLGVVPRRVDMLPDRFFRRSPREVALVGVAQRCLHWCGVLRTVGGLDGWVGWMGGKGGKGEGGKPAAQLVMAKL